MQLPCPQDGDPHQLWINAGSTPGLSGLFVLGTLFLFLLLNSSVHLKMIMFYSCLQQKDNRVCLFSSGILLKASYSNAACEHLRAILVNLLFPQWNPEYFNFEKGFHIEAKTKNGEIIDKVFCKWCKIEKCSKCVLSQCCLHTRSGTNIGLII